MTKRTPRDLADQLRSFIQQSGLSYNELGRQSGIAHGVISRFMLGQRSIGINIAAVLCRTLGLKLIKRK